MGTNDLTSTISRSADLKEGMLTSSKRFMRVVHVAVSARDQ